MSEREEWLRVLRDEQRARAEKADADLAAARDELRQARQDVAALLDVGRDEIAALRELRAALLAHRALVTMPLDPRLEAALAAAVAWVSP